MALVGLPNAGKSTLFENVASNFVKAGELTGTHRQYQECKVQVGLDEVSLIDLPNIDCMHHWRAEDLAAQQYILWGDDQPPISVHEKQEPPAPFAPPNLIIQVIDATALERHLELTLQLAQLGRPMVVALNRMDEADKKGLIINAGNLSNLLGVPVVPTVAITGHGIAELFSSAITTVRQATCPLPYPPSRYLMQVLQPLSDALNDRDIHSAFRIPHLLLLLQIASNDDYFLSEIKQHFPDRFEKILKLKNTIGKNLPRSLADEIHADRHHQAALLYEKVARIGGPYARQDWRYWADEILLHPQWGLLGSLFVFALILFFVFEVSAWIDALTIAPLIDWADKWQTTSLVGVIAHAIADGFIGLLGIVLPYMLPLVALLVALEETGIMQRIAFVVDRGFHHIGLRGGIAASFLLGLGCNVPAISSAAAETKGRERIIASMLITFVPCSARSAIILALAGKYLGGLAVFMIFMGTLIVIAFLGRLLSLRNTRIQPGKVTSMPAFTLPNWRSVAGETWFRTSDIITIVMPLLIGGSVVLALLSYVGADHSINVVLTPITEWWLGLPVALGVPMLFGVLRKELSLIMIYQALGTFEISPLMSWIQIATFLIFLTFYVPCISTFAVMIKTIGKKYALLSVGLSVGVALAISGAVRFVLIGMQYLAG
ncbi:MAG: ferrous iron transporter B [Gammaproteobacteria bacterium]|nr:ferrous iron transporter B [Gammaproteobacteria bacterium]